MQSEAEALEQFAKSIGHPSVPLIRWQHRGKSEPITHRRWRKLAIIMYRFHLYLDAGLPCTPSMLETMREIHQQERLAYARWIRQKRRLEMDYLSGRIRRCPLWPC